MQPTAHFPAALQSRSSARRARHISFRLQGRAALRVTAPARWRFSRKEGVPRSHRAELRRSQESKARGRALHVCACGSAQRRARIARWVSKAPRERTLEAIRSKRQDADGRKVRTGREEERGGKREKRGQHKGEGGRGEIWSGIRSRPWILGPGSWVGLLVRIHAHTHAHARTHTESHNHGHTCMHACACARGPRRLACSFLAPVTSCLTGGQSSRPWAGG